MLTFPYTAMSDAPAEGSTVEASYPVEIVESRSGIEQRRALSAFPRHKVRVKWERDMNAATRVNTLWDFYRQTRGALLPFVYFDFDDARTWTEVYVGTGNGSALVFDLPMLNGSSVTVKVNGTTKTPTTHYTIAAGAGANGRDKLTFTAGNAPASGALVTVTFTGRRSFAMRIASEALSYSVMSALIYSTGLEMVEVKGEV